MGAAGVPITITIVFKHAISSGEKMALRAKMARALEVEEGTFQRHLEEMLPQGSDLKVGTTDEDTESTATTGSRTTDPLTTTHSSTVRRADADTTESSDGSTSDDDDNTATTVIIVVAVLAVLLVTGAVALVVFMKRSAPSAASGHPAHENPVY